MASNELYHHGRLGQRKGVLNGPPYPLDRETVAKEYGGKYKKSNRENEDSDKENKQKIERRQGKSLSEKKKRRLYFEQLKPSFIRNLENRKKKKQDAEKVAKLRQIKAEKAAKRLQEAAEKTAWEEAKKKAIERGDVETAKKYIDRFSNEELSALSERARVIRSLFPNDGQPKQSRYTPEESATRDEIMKKNDLQKAYENQSLFTSNELQEMMNKQSNLDKIKEKNSPLSKVEKAANVTSRAVDLVLNNANRVENLYKIAKNVDNLIKLVEGNSDGQKPQPSQQKQAQQQQTNKNDQNKKSVDEALSNKSTKKEAASKVANRLFDITDKLAKRENLSKEQQRDYEDAKRLIKASAKNPDKVQKIWNAVKDESYDNLFSDPAKLANFLKKL